MAKQHRLRKRILTLAVGGALLGAAALGISWKNNLQAQEEIPEGTPLNKGNLDQLLGKNFDGHAMRDLIPPFLETFIRDYNWRFVRLMKSHENDPKMSPVKKGMIESTNLFKGQAKLNPTTKKIENYTAGIPFLDISLDDPLAGYKVMQNAHKPSWLTDQALGLADGMLINGKSGPEKQIGFTIGIFRFRGRQHQPWVVESVPYHSALMIFQKYPTDAKGVGMMLLMYPDARTPDIYAYVRMIRRTRRLSGNAWGDPLAGTDLTFDGLLGIVGDPSWYPEMKLKSKRHVLGLLHGEQYLEKMPKGWGQPGMVSTASDLPGRFPQMDLKSPPYWVLEQVGEPLSVYEVEITPPKGFLWSKRVMYIGATRYFPAAFWGEEYDRKGKLWKVLPTAFFFVEDAEKEYGIAPYYFGAADLQRNHATMIQPDVPRWQPVWNQGSLELSKQITPDNIPNLVE